MEMKEKPLLKGKETVKITVVLDKKVYMLIERISMKLGLEPPEWINFVISSKVKGLSLKKRAKYGGSEIEGRDNWRGKFKG
jgi:hypothetical protein